MGTKSILKIFGVLGIGGIALLVFFQDEIMVNLIEPIRNTFLKIFFYIPIILYIAGGIFLIIGIINRHRRSYLIFSGLCFIFGLWIANPGGLEEIVNLFSGNPPTPKGWH